MIDLTKELDNNQAPLFFTINPLYQLPSIFKESIETQIPFQIALEVKESNLPANDSEQESWRETISINNTDHVRLKPKAIEDIWIVCEYTVT